MRPKSTNSGAWGDGFIDELGPASWSNSRRGGDLDADELVVFRPVVLLGSVTGDAQSWLIPHLQMAAGRLLHQGTRAPSNVVARAGYSTSDNRSGSLQLRLDLCPLSILDRMTREAQTPRPPEEGPVSIAEAVLASMYSQINAAYVYPHLAWAHETFATAAWLGILISGRSAWMPACVAQTLLEYSQDLGAPKPSYFDRIGYLMRTTTARKGLFDKRLVATAKRVVTSGRPALFKAPRLGDDGSRPSAAGNPYVGSSILQRMAI